MNKFSFKKFTLLILIIVISFSFSFFPPKPVKAQFAVVDAVGAAWDGIKWAGAKAMDALKYAYDKGGAVAFQQTLRTALNKIAIDSATWVASGDKGQKPLFITEATGEYFANIADEAAGEFIESFVNNWNISHSEGHDSDVEGLKNCISQREACLDDARWLYAGTTAQEELEEEMNRCLQEYSRCAGTVEKQSKTTTRPVAVCQPSSLDVKLRISLGLVEHTRPRAPTCTASDLIRNWSDEISRLDYRTWDDRDYMNRLTGIFNPTQSDLGIALHLQSDIGNFQKDKSETAKLNWAESGRWLDVVGISGSIESLPGQAQMEAEIAQTSRIETLGTYTGDAFIDAANIFINTLALQYYNRLMQGFGKTVDDFQSVDLTRPDSAVVSYDDVKIKEKISKILEPAFSKQADYNIVSELSLCPDPENPGPTDCVIDTSLMQAINEKKTVIEAIKDGSLKANWFLTIDNQKNKDNAYTLRNISILRKHRILPIGWEIAASLNENKGATLMDLVSCFDINDDISEFSSSFDLRNTDWCQGLIDPYWVLKAPLSLCQKQGIGSQILNSQILAGQIGLPNMPDVPSRLSVTRDETYCADDLTCIKEDSRSGACLAYGYCNEEKRIWSFDYPSCQPVYNTCTAFTDPQGAQIAYLENTLDYGICSQENAGCLPYYTRGNYDLSSSQINWQTNPLVYFNNKLASCSVSNEGCNELMRVNPAWGSNLIMGADFQYDEIGDNLESGFINNYWPIAGSGFAEIVDGQALGFSSQKVLKLTTNNAISLYSDSVNSLIADNLPLIPGYSYTFSADIYIVSGDGVKLVIGDDDTFSQATSINSWQRIFQTYHLDVNNPQISSLEFSIKNLGSGAEFYLRNLKLEISSWESDYSPYGSYKIYQKIIPQYLENVCYQDVSSTTKDYRLRDDAPAICSNFARQCNINEVGCLMLTNEKHNFSVPAQPVTSDYCPRECESYNVYVAQASHFYSAQAENLIPYNSQVCSANAVGCTEFTNLDDIASDGEKKEYYTHLKHCIKPDSNKCANFYSWEGDDESGYQLKVMNLEKDGDQPKLTSADNSCTEETYNLSPWHPEFNPDCRQFYNQAGNASYHLMSKTITCSENCHTYRMTDININPETDEIDCKNNGSWSDTHNACLYQAIPGEGKTCNANMAACREYSGSDGSNVRLVAADDFQANSGDWQAYCGYDLQLSNVSVSQNGRSLFYQANSPTSCDSDESVGLGLNLGHNLRQNKSYSIKLLARARTNDAQVEFFFTNDDDNLSDIKFYPDPITIKAGEWQIYELNLPNFNRSVDSDETLMIQSNHDFYIDNIAIREVSDRYYLIANTSQIPDICYYDILDNYQGADYNLGCSRWTDSLANNHFLRKISKLCSESSVGCELMIDTNNKTDWRSSTLCEINNDFCVDVDGDKFIAAIYDRTNVCSSDNKGCSRMGQVVGSGNNQVINTVYRKNSPENYVNSLCSEEAVDCQQWQTDTGYQYFKDPKNNACVYRQSRDSNNAGEYWFMKDVKRCDLGNGNMGNVCLDDDDCLENSSCILDKTDYTCSVSYFETIGFGGLTNRVPTPNMQAGICPLDVSGCTEYIDPISQFSPNLLFNPNYQGNPVEGWGIGNNNNNQQDIDLVPNTLYLFTANRPGVKLELARDARIFQLSDNKFASEVVYELEIQTADEKIYFHSQLNQSAKVTGGAVGRSISVKPVIVDYQLEQNINYEACNGLVNFNNGCVLFNERSFNGASGIAQLNLDAFASETNSPAKSCVGDFCDANRLIKVKPDRVCARWLDCRTYIDDPNTGERICYDLGECTHLNDQNECINYVSYKDDSNNPMVFDYKEFNIHNITGYSLLNRYFIGEMNEVGLNTSVHYDFETTNIALACRRGIQTAYSSFPNTSGICNFENNIVTDSLVIEPDKEDTDYPAQGRGYLKVLAYYQIAPHSKNETFQLIPDQKYYLHYLLNTKEAGIDARVLLYNFKESIVIWEEPVNAHNGWERIIHEIDTSNFRDNELRDLQLYLTADTNNLSRRYVYFDDIHIEPVLKAGPNEFIAKDCRLYPEIDSLSCSSVSDNVIKNGLEGYCLEKDPINSDVCLTWYPIDHISSSQLSSSVGGYQGKQPLYYCAEADGNFELLEKRTASRVGAAIWKDIDPESYFFCDDDFNGYGNLASGSCCESGQENSSIRNALCGVDENYLLVASKAVEVDNDWNFWAFAAGPIAGLFYNWFSSGPTYYFMEFACIPKSRDFNLKIKERNFITLGNFDDERDKVCTINYYDGWGEYDGFNYYNPTKGSEEEEKIINFFGIDDLLWIHYSDYCDDLPEEQRESCSPIDEFKNFNPPVAVYDYNNPPKFEDDLKFITHDNIDKVYQPTCNRFVQLVDPYGVNKAWASRVSQSSDPYLTPKWMTESIENHPFYDENIITENDYGCKFKDGQPSCNQDYLCSSYAHSFIKCEYDWESGQWEPQGCCDDSRRDGCAPDGPPLCIETSNGGGQEIYCDGLNPEYNCTNIDDEDECNSYEYCEYIPQSGHDTSLPFIRYGQNRQDAPYGSAILSDNFNFYSSLPIPFKNQYSSRNNQTIFAGRPYGCDGPGCKNIGQCSLNPNVYCIYDPLNRPGSSKINSDSCAKGNFGTCTPLWQGNYDWLTSGMHYTNRKSYFFEFPLRSLFLKSYGGFEFDYGKEGGYKSEKGFDCSGNEDYFIGPGNSELDPIDCSKIERCPNDPVRNANEWCLIFPRIRNVSLNRVSDDESISISSNSDGAIDIEEPGLYYIEFNSLVDIEQEPLSQIEINWGDGNFQVLNNQSHKPNTSNPHRIYHFYTKNSLNDFNIKIIDNWGAYSSYLDNSEKW
jgi:hypothetical protein